MARIIMVAALVFLTVSVDAQSEHGGVGGPYTPMKFVVNDTSIIRVPADSSENDPDILNGQLYECTISKYGESLSALT